MELEPRPGQLSWWAFLVVAGPPLLVTVVSSLVLVAALFGFHPWWSESRVTLAEAAALSDTGLMVRLLEEGADPDQRSSVGPFILKKRDLQLTPLEAAIAARRAHVVKVLLRHGARADLPLPGALACLALQVGARDIAAILDRAHPVRGPGPRCEDVKVPWE